MADLEDIKSHQIEISLTEGGGSVNAQVTTGNISSFLVTG